MQSELAFHAESLLRDIGESLKIVQSHQGCLDSGESTHQQSRGCLGPWRRPRRRWRWRWSGRRWQSRSRDRCRPLESEMSAKALFVWRVWKCMAGSSWLSEGKLVTKQTDYQTEALHQVQSSPALSQGQVRKGKLRISRISIWLGQWCLEVFPSEDRGYLERVINGIRSQASTSRETINGHFLLGFLDLGWG